MLTEEPSSLIEQQAAGHETSEKGRGIGRCRLISVNSAAFGKLLLWRSRNSQLGTLNKWAAYGALHTMEAPILVMKRKMEFTLYKNFAFLVIGLTLVFITAAAQAKNSTATLTATLSAVEVCQIYGGGGFNFDPVPAGQPLTNEVAYSALSVQCSTRESSIKITLSDGRQPSGSLSHDFFLQNGTSTSSRIPFMIDENGNPNTPAINDSEIGIMVKGVGMHFLGMSEPLLGMIDVANSSPHGYPAGNYSDIITLTLTYT